jgi:hypothetical protein
MVINENNGNNQYNHLYHFLFDYENQGSFAGGSIGRTSIEVTAGDVGCLTGEAIADEGLDSEQVVPLERNSSNRYAEFGLCRRNRVAPRTSCCGMKIDLNSVSKNLLCNHRVGVGASAKVGVGASAKAVQPSVSLQ